VLDLHVDDFDGDIRRYLEINNEDHAGNSIISRITNTLGSLKTLSGFDKGGETNRNFNLFTHHAKVQKGEPLELTYPALREAVLELFLSVKIRSDEDIDNYNENIFKAEKKELANHDGFSLIDQIKQSIEMLMNMKVEEQDELEHPELFSGGNSIEPTSDRPRSYHFSGKRRIDNSTIVVELNPMKPIRNEKTECEAEDDYKGQIIV
jgi:hypothetical protein